LHRLQRANNLRVAQLRRRVMATAAEEVAVRAKVREGEGAVVSWRHGGMEGGTCALLLCHPTHDPYQFSSPPNPFSSLPQQSFLSEDEVLDKYHRMLRRKQNPNGQGGGKSRDKGTGTGTGTGNGKPTPPPAATDAAAGATADGGVVDGGAVEAGLGEEPPVATAAAPPPPKKTKKEKKAKATAAAPSTTTTATTATTAPPAAAAAEGKQRKKKKKEMEKGKEKAKGKAPAPAPPAAGAGGEEEDDDAAALAAAVVAAARAAAASGGRAMEGGMGGLPPLAPLDNGVLPPSLLLDDDPTGPMAAMLGATGEGGVGVGVAGTEDVLANLVASPTLSPDGKDPFAVFGFDQTGWD
jgi:hypothetical protein